MGQKNGWMDITRYKQAKNHMRNIGPGKERDTLREKHNLFS